MNFIEAEVKGRDGGFRVIIKPIADSTLMESLGNSEEYELLLRMFTLATTGALEDEAKSAASSLDRLFGSSLYFTFLDDEKIGGLYWTSDGLNCWQYAGKVSPHYLTWINEKGGIDYISKN